MITHVSRTAKARDQIKNLLTMAQQSYGRFSEAVSDGKGVEAEHALAAIEQHARKVAEAAAEARRVLSSGEPVWKAERALQAMRSVGGRVGR